MRRSLFGSGADPEYRLFQNPLIFTEDGAINHLNAEHYVMLGNFDRDPDRFAGVRTAVCSFLQSPELGAKFADDATIDAWLNVRKTRRSWWEQGTLASPVSDSYSQKVRLEMWLDFLDREKLNELRGGSYEVVPLLAEYSPQINAQQLKNALVSPEERTRVEKLIGDHGKLSARSLIAAAGASGPDAEARSARRWPPAFYVTSCATICDLRRLEALNAALDSVKPHRNPKMRELSAMNGNFTSSCCRTSRSRLKEKVLGARCHPRPMCAILRLTKSLMARGLNPASFSA